jgi:hypothetical protein
MRAVLLALALLAAGCSTTSDPPRPGGSTVTPEQSRDLVVRALTETGRAVTALGATGQATGSYAQCTDQGGAVQYVADARLDPAAPGGDTGAALEPALRQAGWIMEPEPTRAPSGNTTRRGLKADLTLRLTSYEDQTFALLQILGPCLPVAGADGYLNRAADRLPLG